MKPRYRILWSKDFVNVCDFWVCNDTRFFYYSTFSKKWMFIPDSIYRTQLKQRVGLKN